MGTSLVGVEAAFVAPLDGLEARIDGQCVALLKEYWALRKLSSWERARLPSLLFFEPWEWVTCARMAVAQ